MVKDLISARSGVFHAGSNSGDYLGHAPARGSQRPVAYWLYSIGTSMPQGTSLRS